MRRWFVRFLQRLAGRPTPAGSEAPEPQPVSAARASWRIWRRLSWQEARGPGMWTRFASRTDRSALRMHHCMYAISSCASLRYVAHTHVRINPGAPLSWEAKRRSLAETKTGFKGDQSGVLINFPRMEVVSHTLLSASMIVGGRLHITRSFLDCSNNISICTLFGFWDMSIVQTVSVPRIRCRMWARCCTRRWDIFWTSQSGYGRFV